MAAQQTHTTFSFIISLVYAFFGGILLAIGAEHVLLATVIVMLSGLLPNVDAGGEPPARELASLLAAVTPILTLHFFPWAHDGGVARVVLVVICCYLIARILIVRFLLTHTTRRGMLHSLPAAVLTAQATYILFFDLPIFERVYVALGAFAGYFSHLLIDAYGNLDIVGKAMGKSERKPSVLKVFSSSMGMNLSIYGAMLVMAWMIAKDFYPGLRIEAGIAF